MSYTVSPQIRTKNNYKNTLSTFLPKETLEMVSGYHGKFPQDFALEQDMTILFSDMRGFTALSEQYNPHKVYETINANLALQSTVIHQFGGSINKFLGDGILACFSGVNRSSRAFKCAEKMLADLQDFNSSLKYLPCHVAFGLNDGPVLFGLLGDSTRREFTVLGDTVNTAARLCGIADPFKALMTQKFIDSLQDDELKERYAFVEKALFKGKREATRIYAICS